MGWTARLLLLTISLPASADYWFIGIGVGDNSNATGCSVCWEDQDGLGGVLVVGREWTLAPELAVRAHWLHLSQYDVGPPFNDKDESSVDHFGIYLEYRL